MFKVAPGGGSPIGIISEKDVQKPIKGIKAALQLICHFVHEFFHIFFRSSWAFAGGNSIRLAANIHFGEGSLNALRKGFAGKNRGFGCIGQIKFKSMCGEGIKELL